MKESGDSMHQEAVSVLLVVARWPIVKIGLMESGMIRPHLTLSRVGVIHLNHKAERR
jgi:hypothetical protein